MKTRSILDQGVRQTLHHLHLNIILGISFGQHGVHWLLNLCWGVLKLFSQLVVALNLNKTSWVLFYRRMHTSSVGDLGHTYCVGITLICALCKGAGWRGINGAWQISKICFKDNNLQLQFLDWSFDHTSLACWTGQTTFISGVNVSLTPGCVLPAGGVGGRWEHRGPVHLLSCHHRRCHNWHHGDHSAGLWHASGPDHVHRWRQSMAWDASCERAILCSWHEFVFQGKFMWWCHPRKFWQALIKGQSHLARSHT